jgi:mono/diheme cytochrome c family protein
MLIWYLVHSSEPLSAGEVIVIADALDLHSPRRGQSMSGYSHQRDARGWGACTIILGLLLLSWAPRWADAMEPGNVEHGMRLYHYYCAPCHGTEGMGTGRNATYLEQMGRAPRDHTDIWYMNRLSDAEIYRSISEGKRRDGEPPFMPWWGYTLTPAEIRSLVAFIRSLARETLE